MGRMLNVFEVSQGHGASKLQQQQQQQQNHSSGSFSSRKKSNSSKGTVGHRSHDADEEQKQGAGERKITQMNKNRKTGLPMKTLIAEEMMRNSDSSGRPPNIIARLMGLDELPKDSSQSNQKNELEKQMWRKQDHHLHSASSSKDLMQVPKTVHTKLINDPLLPRPHNLAFTPVSAVAAQAPKNKIEGQQQRNPKDEFGNKRLPKVKADPEVPPLESFRAGLAEDKFPSSGSGIDPKIALVRQKFLDAKRLASDQRHLQSREFIEAVEFLQSNKDAFLKFLEDPNSLFSKKSQPLVPDAQLKRITVLRSCSSRKTSKEIKEGGGNGVLCKGPLKTNENQVRKLVGLGDPAERQDAKEDTVQQTASSKPVPKFPTPDQFRQYAALHSDFRSNSTNSFPTRIVVLKPSSGKAQYNCGGTSLSCPESGRMDFNAPTDLDISRNADYLREVRVRLEMELAKNKRENSDNFSEQNHVDEQIYSKDVGRGITTQLGQATARDFVDERAKNKEGYISGCDASASSSSRLESECRDIYPDLYSPDSKTLEASGSGSSSSNTLSMFVDSAESVVNKEAKKRLLERWKSTHGYDMHTQQQQQQQQQTASTLGEMLSFSLRKKLLAKNKGSDHMVMDSNKNEGKKSLPCMNEPKDTGKKSSGPGVQNKNRESSAAAPNNADHSSLDSPRGLQRSRSLPVSASRYDEGITETSFRASISDPTNTHNIIANQNMINGNTSTETVKSRKEKSSFKGKVSSFKGSFLLRGKHSSNAKSGSERSLQPASEQRRMSQETRNSSKNNQGRYGHTPDTTKKQGNQLVSHASASKSETPNKNKNKNKNKNILPSKAHGRKEKVASLELPAEELSSPCSPIKKVNVFGSACSANNPQNFEHPSPVSVLDTHFEEDLSSTNDFKEISTNLNDLRMQLNSLKLGTSDKSTPGPGDLLYGNLTPNSFESEADSMRGNSCSSSSDADWSHTPTSFISQAGNFDIESLNFGGIACSEEQQPDLLYLKNVLEASGFNGDINHFFARWHSPSSPLDPFLFDKLEGQYQSVWELEFNAACETKSHRSKSERHLVFDCINEVLLQLLSPMFNHRPWIGTSKMTLRRRHSGKQLMQEIWAKLACYLYPASQDFDTLEDIIENDLSGEGVWMDLVDHEEAVGIDLERWIFADLIEDVVCDLMSRR